MVPISRNEKKVQLIYCSLCLKMSDSLDFCGHNLQLTIFTSVCCEFGVYKKSLLVGQKIASEDRLAQGKAWDIKVVSHNCQLLLYPTNYELARIPKSTVSWPPETWYPLQNIHSLWKSPKSYHFQFLQKTLCKTFFVH